MENKVSKNLQKTGETGVIVSVATVLAAITDKIFVQYLDLVLPEGSSAALVVIYTAALGGLYNFIKHRKAKVINK
ncbi:MAG: hypothetical protein EHM87_16145 [Burkholderiales bacterium]|nr:MAG: hypothetical protein EHM87_16145 [Burkholderiales bacterium]